ncbi:hypothetical protein OA78_2210 [Latilactobacillus curvatus]|nr:hypothetical protein OA78_2210 [Latilactobacillus curvatus]
MNTLIFLTCFHQQLPALCYTYQIIDYVANSLSYANAQKLTVDDALLLFNVLFKPYACA